MKIAFFDYWTRGISNFVPLNEELSARGHSTILLHIGSFREPHPREERLNGILARDISYYQTRFIYRMLEREMPDVVISLNTTYILDRALVLAARELGIKTVFLMHGNKAWQEQTEARLEIARKSFNSLTRRLSRVGKYALNIIPNYFFSYLQSSAKSNLFKPMQVVFRYFQDPGYCFYFPPAPEEITHDRCLVYANSDVEYYGKVGYKRDVIYVTGNPKLDIVQRRLRDKDFPVERLPKEVAAWIEKGRKFAVLIEDSFPESGMGWTREDRNDYLNQVAAVLKENNFGLVVKIHPSSKAETIQIADPTVLQYTNQSLDDLLFHCEFCITHFSTAVNQAVLLGKTILQPRWGKSAQIMDYYIQRKVSRAWEDPNVLPSIAKIENDVEKYKREYISVLTPDATQNIVERIVKW